MIKDKTVFVLGAGASMPYGFPSGAELSRDIATQLANGQSELFRRLQMNGANLDHMREFPRLFRESGRESIDSFLQSRTEFRQVGKMAIFHVLANRESENDLFPQDHDWMRYLLARMSGANPDEFRRNQLRVITFNFDRSFERRLFLAVRANYNLGDAEAFELCSSTVPVHHMHGDLAGC